MVKKQKQKQKQKQSQVTKVTVKVGDTNKPKRQSRPRAPPPPPRPQSNVSVTLQGSGVQLPPPPTQQYNELSQQMDLLRRQMALSGSLIPRGATNDLLNRVEATNPFDNLSNFVPASNLIRPEGVAEEMVEGATTIDPTESHGFASHVAYDQDWLRNVSLASKAQSLPATTKIAVANEDPETIQDISNYDRQEKTYQTKLGEDLDEFISGAKGRHLNRQIETLKRGEERAYKRIAKGKGKPNIEFIEDESIPIPRFLT